MNINFVLSRLGNADRRLIWLFDCPFSHKARNVSFYIFIYITGFVLVWVFLIHKVNPKSATGVFDVWHVIHKTTSNSHSLVYIHWSLLTQCILLKYNIQFALYTCTLSENTISNILNEFIFTTTIVLNILLQIVLLWYNRMTTQEKD